MIGNKVFKMAFPDHTGYKELFVLGVVAAIGFTVAIFVTTVAFGEPPAALKGEEFKGILIAYEKEMKMGALLSFLSGFTALVLGKVLKIKKVE